jgi:hypothetical protein
MKQDLKFIRNLFKTNLNSFKEYLRSSEKIEHYSCVWSNNFLDFFPFCSEMGQIRPPKIYREKPLKNTNVILTKVFEEQMYYAAQMEKANWGTEFYLYNYSEKMNVLLNEEDYFFCFTPKTKELLKNEGYLYSSPFKIRLRFDDQNDDEKMKLSQVEFVSFDNKKAIKKVIFYSLDKDAEEETFMVDTYFNNEDNKVCSIERNGFYDDEENVSDTRTFRFEYINDKVNIYTKQLKLNGEFTEQQLFPCNF